MTIDATLIKENLNQTVRDILAYCAVMANAGETKKAAEILCLSTQTVNTLAAWWEHFGNREDQGIEPETPFLIDSRWLRAIVESPNPQDAHEVAHAERLNTRQIRERFPIEKRQRTARGPVYQTTIIEPELTAGGTFKAFVDLGDLPPEEWPAKATMVIVEKR